MCWSFSLFIVALSIFIAIQCLLIWCSHLRSPPIWDPNFWEGVLAFFASLGCIAVVAAVALLVVTVYSLKFNVDKSVEYNNPNAANWDAKLVFDTVPKDSAVVAFAVSSCSLSYPDLFQSIYAWDSWAEVLLIIAFFFLTTVHGSGDIRRYPCRLTLHYGIWRPTRIVEARDGAKC